MYKTSDILNKVICEDCLTGLKKLPDNYFNSCITSPPYFKLRDYSVDGQLGLEETPELYIEKLVDIFREVKRVLRKDGTVWLNLGDSYAGSGKASGQKPEHKNCGKIKQKRGYDVLKPTLSSRVSNASNFLHSEFENGIFFFGSPNPAGSSTECIYILIYDKCSPNQIFSPFFTSKRVSIKNGQNNFCEIGNLLNPPVHCFISSTLSLTLPNNSNLNNFIDISNNIGIIITATDLNTNTLIGSSVPFSIKNSKASFTIKIPREPIPEIIWDGVPLYDSISFNSFSEGFPNINSMDDPVPLLNGVEFAPCFLGDFRIRKASDEQISFNLHSGCDLSFLCVRHLFLFNIGLCPYSAIWSKVTKKINYYQPKQEIGIPFMVRKALMEEGWICRQTIIWHKRNPMPESVTDRCTKSHEYIFLLSKSAKYYYDADAIKEKSKYPEDNRKARVKETAKDWQRIGNRLTKGSQTYFYRNKRSVWTINTKPYSEAHFAVYPEKLIEDCIKAGCPEGGIVLDPFAGSNTTGIVARKQNKNFISIELNPEYVKMAEKRMYKELGMFV